MGLLLTAAMLLFSQDQGRPVSTPGSVSETGTEFYLRYQAAIPKATRIEELQAFWSAVLVQQVNGAPPEQRADLDGMKRIYSMLSSVKVVTETTDSTRTRLDLEGVNKDGRKVTGAVSLIRENGAWKLSGPESWNQG